MTDCRSIFTWKTSHSITDTLQFAAPQHIQGQIGIFIVSRDSLCHHLTIPTFLSAGIIEHYSD